MGETTDQIERRIEQNRSQLSDNFSELEQKVKSVMDWRVQFQMRPGTMLAAAFGGGVLISAILGRTRSSPKFHPAGSEKSREAEYSKHAFVPSSEDPRRASPIRENWEALGGALLNVAVSRASTLFDSLLPGFEREFTRMKSSGVNAPPNSGSYSETTAERERPHSAATYASSETALDT